MSASALNEDATIAALIAYASGTAERRAVEHTWALQLGGRVNWDRLATVLAQRRLLALLGPRLSPLAVDRSREDFATAVHQATEHGRRHGGFLQMVAELLRAKLTEAGIRSRQLKGPALGELLYGDLGRRPASDIDVLVEADRLAEAVELARTLSYEAPLDRTDRVGLPQLHFAMLHERRELPPLELHWRVHWYERRFAAERLLPPRGVASESWRANPADELGSLLLFYARDGFMNARHAVDIGAWWDLTGDRLPDAALDELGRAYPPLRQALLAAAKVAERTVGLPFEQLSHHGDRLSPRGRLAVRLASPRQIESEPQIYAEMGLIDGLLAPRAELGSFIRRQILPPQEPALAHRPLGRIRSVGTPLAHAVRSLARYALTLVRLLRPASSGAIAARPR